MQSHLHLRKTLILLTALLFCQQVNADAYYYPDDAVYYADYGYGGDCCPNDCCDIQDMVVSGSFLYWKMEPSHTRSVRQTNDTFSATADLTKRKEFHLKPSWQTGYRLALETPFAFCNQWICGIEWTDYTGRSKLNKSFHAKAGQVMQVEVPNSFITGSQSLSQASVYSTNQLCYRDFSVWLAKNLCWDCFTLKPFIAFEYLYTREKYHAKVHTVSPATPGATQPKSTDLVHDSADWHTAGGSLGLEALIDLDCGFSLEAYGAFDGLYGKFKATKRNQFTLSPAGQDHFNIGNFPSDNKQHSKQWNGRFVAESRIGVHWKRRYEGFCSVDASLDWEYIYLFRGLRIQNYRGYDVALQGLTATLTLGF